MAVSLSLMSQTPIAFTVGALVFPGFEVLDVYGPLEMWGMLREKGVSITMLAAKPGPVASSQGPRTIAEAALDEAAKHDVLLVPGGFGTRQAVRDGAFLESLARKAAEVRYVASVCTGSTLLARAGLLDGKRATSNKRAWDWVVTQGPNVLWVRKARWVEDGRFFTSSGVSAGMDMTLGLIQHVFGRDTSLEIARRAEYSWHEDKTTDPFAE
jgi:transcriptional regulator GlxA family with amidase domain